MRWRVTLAALVLLGVPALLGADDAAARRLLVVTHTEGFRHDSIPAAEEAIASIGRTSGLFDVTFCRTAEDVRRMLVPSSLESFDGVFFANTSGDLGIPDLDVFLAWIASGHAFLGAHSASDTYHATATDRRYVEMLGGEFDRHGSPAEVAARVERRRNVAAASLPSPYVVLDEIYEFKESPRGRSEVLYALDRHPNDGHDEAGRAGDFPLAWCRGYGTGLVFYTALGHRTEIWQSAVFREHLLGAIRWALRIPARPLSPAELSRERSGVVRRNRR